MSRVQTTNKRFVLAALKNLVRACGWEATLEVVGELYPGIDIKVSHPDITLSSVFPSPEKKK